jgi:hypothetical protein
MPNAAQFASAPARRYGSRACAAGQRGLLSDIFREIDEELRRDNLIRLLSRYWPHLAGVVVVALALAGGIAGWRQHQLSLRQAESTRYAAALTLAAEGKDAEAAALFGAIAQGSGGYPDLAAFEQAALLAKSGHRQQAIAIYDHIAATNPHPAFRDLAVLLAAMQQMQMPEAAAKTVIAKLKPLTAPGNPWRPSALELTALAELENGDRSGARRLYQGLADDLSAPSDLRARAAEMVAALAS